MIRATRMPYTGPRAKAPRSSGRSEKSIWTKDGMIMGRGKSMNISTKATADSMAVTVSLRMRSRSWPGACMVLA